MAAARSRTTSEAPVAGSPAHRLSTRWPAALRRLASAIMSITANGGTAARLATVSSRLVGAMPPSCPGGPADPRRVWSAEAQLSSTTSASGAFFLMDSIASSAERFWAYCWLLARMLPLAATTRNQNSPLFSLWWTVNLNAMACSAPRAGHRRPAGTRHRPPTRAVRGTECGGESRTSPARPPACPRARPGRAHAVGSSACDRQSAVPIARRTAGRGAQRAGRRGEFGDAADRERGEWVYFAVSGSTSRGAGLLRGEWVYFARRGVR